MGMKVKMKVMRVMKMKRMKDKKMEPEYYKEENHKVAIIDLSKITHQIILMIILTHHKFVIG